MFLVGGRTLLTSRAWIRRNASLRQSACQNADHSTSSAFATTRTSSELQNFVSSTSAQPSRVWVRSFISSPPPSSLPPRPLWTLLTRVTTTTTDISRAVADSCGVPRRSRKDILMLAWIAEIPAFFCPWLRLYTNWKLQAQLALDDYLMTAAGVSFWFPELLGAVFEGEY